MDPVIRIPDHFKHRNVSVWWDMQDCPLPDGCCRNMVIRNIESALGDLGYDSISSISAYKNWALNVTGWSEDMEMIDVNCLPVHVGKKKTAVKLLMTHMLKWSLRNKDPTTYLLLATDKDYANTLFNLKLNHNYILLAHPGELLNANPLVDASDVVLDFNALFRGIGKLSK